VATGVLLAYAYGRPIQRKELDGSVHDEPAQASHDGEVRRELVARSYRVITIRHDRAILEQVQDHADVFGQN
jgi:hypothetical protein